MFKDEKFIEWKKSNPSFTIDDLEEGFENLHLYYGPCKGGFICYEGSTNSIPDET